MLSGSRISWINEASTKVSSLTMCVKTCRSFVMNSCFADSSIRKRTTSVILSDIFTSFMPCHRKLHVCSIGNKKQLFRKALDRYQTGHMSFLAEALRKSTARDIEEA